MVTATCINTDCRQHGIENNVIGEPSRVECGACYNDCELTDLRDDPPMPEPFEVNDGL